ncbi:MAG: VWA domain-containing protein [Myxococcales bacterium]|nr:VWA domain-containing protein [Myxococcales bacterium]
MDRRWMWAGVITATLGAACGEGSSAAPIGVAAKKADKAEASEQGKAGPASSAAAARDEGGYAVHAPADKERAEEAAEEPAAAATAAPTGGGGLVEAQKAAAGRGAGGKGAGRGWPGEAKYDSSQGDVSGKDGKAKTNRPQLAQPAQPEPAAPPPALVETPIDPNGRFATTYRPGGGHLSAFESAVAAGILPASEREIVSDIGARYAPTLEPPKEGALAFGVDFERGKLAPSGGPVHVRLSLRSTSSRASERPPLSVVVVMDVSGSMRGQLIQAARTAASDLVDKLGANDDFSLVTFSTDAQVMIPMGKVGARRESLKKTIGDIVEGGGTNIGEGLRLGYEQASDKAAAKDGVRVVFLMSDGRANEGITNRGQLSKLSLDAFQEGIQTSSFGMGTDYDGPLMSQIAQDGAGGYYYLRDAAQIPGALATELDKRLEPVATAVEVRLRLKPDVELLNVYGSRRLSESEASRVRQIEVAQDQQTQKRDGIKANRQTDVEGGMRFFMPSFAKDDSHSILLKLRLPEGVGAKDVALVELKYKDRITKKNVTTELPIKLEYANSDVESAKSIDPSVARTVQGFAAGETLMKASVLIGQNQHQKAIDLLGEREGLLHHAAFALGEPLFVEDAKRLARLRVHAAGKGSLKDPLVLAMMMETAGSVHLH